MLLESNNRVERYFLNWGIGSSFGLHEGLLPLRVQRCLGLRGHIESQRHLLSDGQLNRAHSAFFRTWGGWGQHRTHGNEKSADRTTVLCLKRGVGRTSVSARCF